MKSLKIFEDFNNDFSDVFDIRLIEKKCKENELH